MASDINHLVITGRLTADAEGKEIGDKTVFSFSLAVNHYDSKEKKDVADFFPVKLWSKTGKQSDFYKTFLTKGSQVVVEARMSQDRWEKDGQKQSRLYVAAYGISPMGKGKTAQPEGEGGVPEYDSSSGFPEDIPY